MIDWEKLKNAKRVEVSFLEVTVDGEFVLEFRNKYGLSQTALANILGVKKKTIEKWEKGKKRVVGSSATLLTLLNDDRNLLEKVYSVKVIEGAGEVDE